MVTDSRFNVSKRVSIKHITIHVRSVLLTTACSESASSIVGNKFVGPDCGYEAIEFHDDGNAYFILPKGADSSGKSKQVSGTCKIDGDRVVVTGSTGALEMTWSNMPYRTRSARRKAHVYCLSRPAYTHKASHVLLNQAEFIIDNLPAIVAWTSKPGRVYKSSII